MSDRKTDQWEERRAGGKGVCALSDEPQQRKTETQSFAAAARATENDSHSRTQKRELD